MTPVVMCGLKLWLASSSFAQRRLYGEHVEQYEDRNQPAFFPEAIIRPTETKGIAMGVVNFLTAMGLFIGQSPAFFNLLRNLAQDADAARRGQLDN
jgi:hypothetical protein